MFSNNDLLHFQVESTIGSLVAGIVYLVLRRRDYASSDFVLTTIAIVCTVGVAILTRLINVPVNETLMTWQVSSPPENVMRFAQAGS